MKSKLIVALDVDSLDHARTLIRDLRDEVSIFKVGSQLFILAGPAATAWRDRVDQRGR
jgi:orotidine-5'-phosphate decarboxylase